MSTNRALTGGAMRRGLSQRAVTCCPGFGEDYIYIYIIYTLKLGSAVADFDPDCEQARFRAMKRAQQGSVTGGEALREQ